MGARHVYIIGAGFSAGLGFPTIGNLLPQMWSEIEEEGLAESLASIIRFNHPDFNASNPDTYPNVEALLSEIQANLELFGSSRPVTGSLTSNHLEVARGKFLRLLARSFHEKKKEALSTVPAWLEIIVEKMRDDEADVISFNWDLVLDQLLLGSKFSAASYGFGEREAGPRLLKPHGSLNWYRAADNNRIKTNKRVILVDSENDEAESVFAFRPFRAPQSNIGREYMPLIVAPVYSKRFDGALFDVLWRETVAVLSRATKVTFIGYSLPTADFHARFILRCGFHNQENGMIRDVTERDFPTGRAHVTVVDPSSAAHRQVAQAVGWQTVRRKMSVEDWVNRYLVRKPAVPDDLPDPLIDEL
ncbi:hypothetical protein [Xanthomonas sp. NCPPB 2632]|uniref:hypothetical protein n=1 Tax=Xanthomonas sp. NCPPB 2632 TaxID=3240912 RepID=UPI003519B881